MIGYYFTEKQNRIKTIVCTIEKLNFRNTIIRKTTMRLSYSLQKILIKRNFYKYRFFIIIIITIEYTKIDTFITNLKLIADT